MKKSLLYIPLAAMALTACDNTQELIFDDSAAERLEQGKAEAIDKLTADGGLWAMEYFSNSDERGYVMLCRFSKDGSVEVSVNHEWQTVPFCFNQETSLWEITSDNGTVLSFCSHNDLFHVFSDPFNITGPYAPTNPDRNNEDIDETGYGHSGDYEFQVMQCEDPNTMRLLGKKRSYNIWMHRLASDTDEKEYLDQVMLMTNGIFTKKFPKLLITDKESGEVFVAHADRGIMNVYPEAGDSITQARKKHFITTSDGIRFSSPFNVLRADGSEYEISEFAFTGSGGLVSDEAEFSMPIKVGYVELLTDPAYEWAIDVTKASDSFAGLLEDFIAEHDAAYRTSRFRDFTFGYDTKELKYSLKMNEAGSSTTPVYYRESSISDGVISFGISKTDVNRNALTRLSKLPTLEQVIDLLNENSFSVRTISELCPSELILTSEESPELYFTLTLK
ncbi:MAG: DUF4302 domain-containing protein [Muribaculaceae bacterium]|nr:DUF4302 domain-containing protein [Muribaculaceae bacterium]